MSPITATAIPEGNVRGAGLRATMASTTAEDWNTAPALAIRELGAQRLPLGLRLLRALPQSCQLVLERRPLALQGRTGLQCLLRFLLQPAHYVALAGEALPHTLLVLGP